MVICANVVGPNETQFPVTIGEMDETIYTFTESFLASESFREKFSHICQMESMPEVSLQQMKTIKSSLMDNLITPSFAEELGDAARLLCSWLDGILEFTILKHEVIVLRLKNQKVLEQIKAVSKLWPKRKEFIEGAYKILLFTKNQRKQVNHAIVCLKTWEP